MVMTMPKKKPNPQTVATEKWQKKAGYMTKGFKIKRALADEFKQTCDKRDTSQAAVISKLMQGYIDGTIKLD